MFGILLSVALLLVGAAQMRRARPTIGCQSPYPHALVLDPGSSIVCEPQLVRVVAQAYVEPIGFTRWAVVASVDDSKIARFENGDTLVGLRPGRTRVRVWSPAGSAAYEVWVRPGPYVKRPPPRVAQPIR